MDIQVWKHYKQIAAHPACVGGRIMVHWQWILQVDRVMLPKNDLLRLPGKSHHKSLNQFKDFKDPSRSSCITSACPKRVTQDWPACIRTLQDSRMVDSGTS